MTFRKLFSKIKTGNRSLRKKLYMSLSSIAVVLLISSIISVMEYSSMSSYVSDMIAENIGSINVASELSNQTNEYNLAILAVIGDESSVRLPDFDAAAFAARCDSLRSSLSRSRQIMPLADSVEYSYSAYMLTSLELEDVLMSDFIDTRNWYFERLQPRFERLRSDIDALQGAVYAELAVNSESFDSTFYRGIVPGMVAVGVGLVLIFMLLFFMNVYYVRPIYRMLESLQLYISYGTPYKCNFPGDDQLKGLNDSISDLVEENKSMRRRISALRAGAQESDPTSENK